MMNIAYNKEGIPFIIQEDGTITDFSPENRNFIVGELATDKPTIDVLFNKVNKTINQKIDEYKNSEKKDFNQLRIASETLRKINYFAGIIEVCVEAENLYYQLITPKPYDSWGWDRNIRDWVPPFPIPAGELNELYTWDDDDITWRPAPPMPGSDYVWSSKNHQWEPIVKYPIDAQPGEFVWDDEKNSWVLASEKNKA
jgi:hypothetical protein